MSPRNLRNTLQRRCDQAKNNVDNTLHHLYAMHQVYYTGEEHPDINEFINPETNEWIREPAYPERVKYLDDLIQLLKSYKLLIDKFKSDFV